MNKSRVVREKKGKRENEKLRLNLPSSNKAEKLSLKKKKSKKLENQKGRKKMYEKNYGQKSSKVTTNDDQDASMLFLWEKRQFDLLVKLTRGTRHVKARQVFEITCK